MPRKYSLPEFWADKTNIAKGTQVHPWAEEILRNQLCIGWVDTDGVIWPFGDTSGHLQCDIAATSIQSLSDILEAYDEPATNADATVTVTAGQIWNILNILATFKVDATVADRSCILTFNPLTGQHSNGPWGTITEAFKIGALVLSASQEGSHFQTGNTVFYNDHDAHTSAITTPILPLCFMGGSIIKTEQTNWAADDRATLSILYQRVK